MPPVCLQCSLATMTVLPEAVDVAGSGRGGHWWLHRPCFCLLSVGRTTAAHTHGPVTTIGHSYEKQMVLNFPSRFVPPKATTEWGHLNIHFFLVFTEKSEFASMMVPVESNHAGSKCCLNCPFPAVESNVDCHEHSTSHVTSIIWRYLGVFPPELGGLDALRTLNLSWNKLRGKASAQQTAS